MAETDPFGVLPNELMAAIFDFVAPHDNCRTRSAVLRPVCRRWARIAWGKRGPPCGRGTDALYNDHLSCFPFSWYMSNRPPIDVALACVKRRSPRCLARALDMALCSDPASVIRQRYRLVDCTFDHYGSGLIPTLDVLIATGLDIVNRVRVNSRGLIVKRETEPFMALVDRKCVPHDVVLNWIVYEGALDMVERIGAHPDRDLFCWHPNLYDTAVRRQDRDMFTALARNQCPFGPIDRRIDLGEPRREPVTLIDFALGARVGIDAIERLRACGASWTERSFAHALRGSDVGVLEYARAHGCPWIPGAHCYAAFICASDAARDWVVSAGLTLDYDAIVSSAICCGFIGALDWCWRRGPPFRSDHLALLEDVANRHTHPRLRAWFRDRFNRATASPRPFPRPPEPAPAATAQCPW